MTISNINTAGLETMNTKDALHFLNAILENRVFRNAEQVFTGNSHLKVIDKNYPKMSNITLLVQSFDKTNKEGEFYILTQSVATDYGCVNSIKIEKISADGWRDMAKFIKRFNEIM